MRRTAAALALPFACLLASSMFRQAYAQATPLNCSVTDVAAKIALQETHTLATSAQVKLPILDEITRLNAKAIDPNKPVGAQLSVRDADRFSSLSQQLRFITANDFIESRHARDEQAIARMWQLSEAEYAAGMRPGDQEPDATYYGFLLLLRLGLGDKISITTPWVDACDLRAAIYFSEGQGIRWLNENGHQLDTSNRRMKALAARYQEAGKPLDRSKMSPSDQSEYDDIMRMYIPGEKTATFIKDMEALRELDKISERKAVLDKDDLVSTGGDFSAIGKSFGAIPMADTDKIYFAVLMLIAQKFPSQEEQQLKNLQQMEKATGIH